MQQVLAWISTFFISWKDSLAFKGMLRRNIEHFLKKRNIWKIRIFWNELTEKNFFFSVSNGLYFLFF